MTNHWVLQGNPKRWKWPERIYTEPILGWSVTGIQQQIHVGDGVLIWMANTHARLRGIYAAGKVAGNPRSGYPLDWGDEKQQATETPFVALAIYWYLVHHPVGVDELKASGFATHQILTMPRRTAYPCSVEEFGAAIELMHRHGPTVLPVRPADTFETWWGMI